MSDRRRILAALRNGPVNSTAFMAPDVLDGGKPITRTAARIQDLQNEGHVITRRLEKNRTATYTLAVDAERGDDRESVSPSPPRTPREPATDPLTAGVASLSTSSLFDPSPYAQRYGYGSEEAA